MPSLPRVIMLCCAVLWQELKAHIGVGPRSPCSYPVMLLISMVPPLYFSIMNPAWEAHQARIAKNILQKSYAERLRFHRS